MGRSRGPATVTRAGARHQHHRRHRAAHPAGRLRRAAAGRARHGLRGRYACHGHHRRRSRPASATRSPSIGIVIGLGVGIGKILEVSGAADALARAFVRLMGKGREHWAMAGTGAMVSIPVFCDSGYVIMNPLARSIARRINGRYVTLALALGCGMTLTHHLVPPTPGPLGVAGILGADIGALVLAGLVFALLLLPVVVDLRGLDGAEARERGHPSARGGGLRQGVTVGSGGSAPPAEAAARAGRHGDHEPTSPTTSPRTASPAGARRHARGREAASGRPGPLASVPLLVPLAADRAQHRGDRHRPQPPGRPRPERGVHARRASPSSCRSSATRWSR